MKLLYLPLHADEFPTGTARAFLNHSDVNSYTEFDYLEEERSGRTADLNRQLNEIVEDFQPDIIHMQLQETKKILPETLLDIKRRRPGIILTSWMGDWRPSVPAYTNAINAACDVALLSNEGQLEMYSQACGKPVLYWQIGIGDDEDTDFSGPAPVLGFKVPEVVFIGRYYGDSAFPDSKGRLLLAEAMAEAGFDFGVVGSGFPIHVRTVGQCKRTDAKWVYKAAKVSLGYNAVNDCERYWSERQIQAMASGTPHVCRWVPGLEKDFSSSECKSFRSFAEAVEIIKDLLQYPVVAGGVGERGRKKVLAEHTWERRVEQYFEILKGQKLL